MSPQPSNRVALLEGALRCLERLPPERVTARAIADESGANLASIGYHFGSKDELVAEAAILGLDRWLEDVEGLLRGLRSQPAATRLLRAADAIEATQKERERVVRAFVACLARAQHDVRVRALLANGFARTRREVASLLGLGTDEVGEEAGGLILSMFHGLMIQGTLDPALAIEGERMGRALARVGAALPADG